MFTNSKKSANINSTSIKVQTLVLGKTTFEGYSRIPVVALVNGEGREVGYLSPFRGYSFQVSGDRDGQGDLGSSQVIGLNNIMDARLGTSRNLGYQSNLTQISTKAELLKGQAMLAINKFCGLSSSIREELGAAKAVSVYRERRIDDMTLDDGRELPFIWGGTDLDRFIAYCIRWLNTGAYEQYTTAPAKKEVV